MHGASMLGADAPCTDDPNGHGTAMAEHRRRPRRQRHRHRRRRLPRRLRDAGQGPRRRRHRPGLRHRRGRRVRRRPRRRRHPDVLLATPAAAVRCRPLPTTPGRRAPCSSLPPATTPPPLRPSPPVSPRSSASRRPTRDDTLWSCSNSGADTFLGAPGVDIVTGSSVSLTGTSASAAIVAGYCCSPAGQRLLRLQLCRSSAGLPAMPTPLAPSTDTGNGRVNLARAVSDYSTDPVVPAGCRRLRWSRPSGLTSCAAKTSLEGWA